jgi:hypothetical protein
LNRQSRSLVWFAGKTQFDKGQLYLSTSFAASNPIAILLYVCQNENMVDNGLGIHAQYREIFPRVLMHGSVIGPEADSFFLHNDETMPIDEILELEWGDIDLNPAAQAARAKNDVIAEAEAITQEAVAKENIDVARVPKYVGVMTARSSTKIFNTDESTTNRFARWNNVDPSLRPPQKQFRRKDLNSRAKPPGQHLARSSEPIIQPSRSIIKDEPTIDLTENEPKVIPPQPESVDKARQKLEAFRVEEEKAKPEKPRWRDRLRFKKVIGVLAVGAVASLGVVGVLASRFSESTESVKQAYAAESVTTLTQAPTAIKEVESKIAKFTPAQKKAFDDMCEWIENNPGQDFDAALRNF